MTHVDALSSSHCSCLFSYRRVQNEDTISSRNAKRHLGLEFKYATKTTKNSNFIFLNCKISLDWITILPVSRCCFILAPNFYKTFTTDPADIRELFLCFIFYILTGACYSVNFQMEARRSQRIMLKGWWAKDHPTLTLSRVLLSTI